MKKNNYNVRWTSPSGARLADVDFSASHDTNAKSQADKLGRDLGVSNSQRTIYCGARLVE